MSILNVLRSKLKKPGGEPSAEACRLLSGAEELDEAVRSGDKLMVLFYAAWCPFSRAFLKIFRARAAEGDPCYARVVVDVGDALVEKYAIAVFPTVLFFDKGALVRRLDGVYHQGLSRDQLDEFARVCSVR
ncbi:MAG TPA: thioredoxin [Candidatus Aminicenantes bacterium]|nr:thioredoxin [Candidatus Aminicenantes bacterium]